MNTQRIIELVSDIHSYVLDDDIDIYNQYVSKLPDFSKIIDLGTGYGKSAIAMALANPTVSIVTIDDGSMPLSNNFSLDVENYRQVLEDSFREHGVKNIHLDIGDIIKLSGMYQNESFDLLHIDMMEPVEMETFRLWLPKLKRGGIALIRNFQRNRQGFLRILEEQKYKEIIAEKSLIQPVLI